MSKVNADQPASASKTEPAPSSDHRTSTSPSGSERFRVQKSSGRGIIIGGVQFPRSKPKAEN